MGSWFSSSHKFQPAMLGIAAAVVVFGTATLSSAALYLRAKDTLIEEVRSDLKRTAVVAASAIDVSLHRQLEDPQQEDGPVYRQVIAPLSRILRSSTSIRFIYTCILRNGVVHFVLDPTPKGDSEGDGIEDHSWLMDTYEEANPVLRAVLAGGPPATDLEPVLDRWGTTFSGYAPFHDDLGNTVGAVGVDIDLATFDSRVAGVRQALWLGVLLALGCSSLVGVVVSRSIASLRKARMAADEHSRVLKVERADAERANRAKDEFLAVMTHEIRTPLNAVIGLADLLLVGEVSEEQHRHLTIIRASGEHLLSMINDILDHSKIEAGRMVMEEAPFSPRDVAEDVANLLREAANAKGLRLELAIDGPVADRVIGDATRLRQVLLNLVSNSIKFTTSGSVVIGLRSAHTGGAITFSVIDTGVGMDSATHRRLFRPFSQGDSSISRRFGGTGLGLSISQRLVGMMGGNITVESSPGRGSAFAFTLALPVTTRPTTSMQRSMPVLHLPHFTGTVLVVDDREVNRQVAVAMVRRLGLAVLEAADGHAALELLKQGGVDLVLMDCQMPGLDGIATTVELRQLEGAGPRTPVVALSAAALPADRERCRLAGMDGFLAKPIRLDQLAGELARFLSARGSETMPPVIAQAAGAVPPPALDAQVVATLRSLDDRVDGFVAMVNGYLREANQTIATLVIDAMSGRREGLGQRAHAMKGAALTMGLTRLAMALDAFERIAHHGDDQALASAGDDLDQAFAEATSALRAECERAPRPSAN